MFRVAVSKQTQPVQTTDPDKFDICLLAQLYRVNQAWPVPKDKVALSSLHNANLAGANLAETNLSGADLSGVNLTDAQSTNSALIDSGTNFTAAICPDGVVVDGRQATTCLGHGF